MAKGGRHSRQILDETGKYCDQNGQKLHFLKSDINHRRDDNYKNLNRQKIANGQITGQQWRHCHQKRRAPAKNTSPREWRHWIRDNVNKHLQSARKRMMGLFLDNNPCGVRFVINLQLLGIKYSLCLRIVRRYFSCLFLCFSQRIHSVRTIHIVDFQRLYCVQFCYIGTTHLLYTTCSLNLYFIYSATTDGTNSTYS